MSVGLAAPRRRLSAILGAAILLLAVVATASGAAGHIQLLVAGASGVDDDGGLWLQGGTGSGTGNFDPFVTYGSNTGTETGLNVCDDPGCPAPQFDTTGVSAGRTHELLASAIPVVEHNNSEYREFSLDANDTGADDYMSIDDVQIYLSSNRNLGSYPFDAPGEANLIYDLPDGTDILMRSQTLTPGSGVSDVTLLVPSDRFGPDCYYGSQTCDQYVFFYVESGHAGVVDGHDYNTTGGFEEWRVALQPVVDVQKTVNPSFDRDYGWTVQKSVSDESIDLFDGDSQPVTWTVSWDRDAGHDSNWAVTGNIAIQNPTGTGFAISEPIPAVITEAPTDVVDIGGTQVTANVSCPVSFPYTLRAGETLTCTYSASLLSGASGTNTATATIEINDSGDTHDYSDTETVDFSSVTPHEIDATATVTDDRKPLGLNVNADGSTTYNETFSCGDDAGTHSNTAVVTEANSGDTHDDTASTTVNCYELGVTKDAHPTFARDFTWTIDKTADPTSIDMFDGAPATTVTWTVTPHRSAAIDSGYAVSGTITISNPAPMVADDVSVSDVVETGIVASVDCDATTIGNQTTVDVPAASGAVNGTATCAYSSSLPDDATRLNTATATLFGEGYTGTASVNFTGVTPTTTNDTATVTDPTAGIDQAASDGVAITATTSASCPSDEGKHDNLATVTPGDGGPTDTASASYTVSCYGLSVSKNALTTFTRDYAWSISKSRFLLSGETDADNDLTTLQLAEGQVYTANYEVLVSQTGHTDSDWAVHGTITVTNASPLDADDVAVSDLVSPAVAALVDCDPSTLGNQSSVDVPAHGSADCAYSADLTDASARTNVATATLFGQDYDSPSVAVTFDDTPDTQIDECIDVTDDNGTPADTTDDSDLGTVCLGDLVNGQKTLETTIDIGPYLGCETDTIVNTASFATTDDANDSDENGSSAYTVNVEVPCPEGCTLTQGYWKTHNDSFKGGAPTDDTWQQIGPLAEQETFFLSGQTYFDVMWTAPQGNAYYNLAHQYIAAVLNSLNDAAVPADVQSALDDATALFENYSPSDVGKAKGKTGNQLRSQFITLAGILGSYNEGAIGPGHCDEDGSSAPALFLPIGLLAPLASRLRRRRMA